MNNEKVHLYKRVESAWDAFSNKTVDAETATKQTVCGYVRKYVTSNKKQVTCKACLRVDLNNA